MASQRSAGDVTGKEKLQSGGAAEEEYFCLLSCIYNNLNTVLYIVVVLWIIKTIIVATKDRWSAYIVHIYTKYEFQPLELVKRDLFKSLSKVVSNDPELRKNNSMRILEIGPGTGANFPHYPEGTQLVVIDPNPHYKDYYYNNINKFKHIHTEQYHVATGEDMSMVPDNSIDVVVVTLVLCLVKDVDKVVQEIYRVLAPGGKFYFMEHITEFDLEKHAFRRKLQHIFTHYIPIWPFLFDGCALDRDPLPNIEKVGFSNVDAERYYAPVPHFVFDPEKPNLKGVATK